VLGDLEAARGLDILVTSGFAAVSGLGGVGRRGFGKDGRRADGAPTPSAAAKIATRPAAYPPIRTAVLMASTIPVPPRGIKARAAGTASFVKDGGRGLR
jgi:hypothetical protein